MKSDKSVIVLLADDDDDDVRLTQEAMIEANFDNELQVVNDGQELMDYLKLTDKPNDKHSTRAPGLILLDLNMPRKDGWQALKEIKSDPGLKNIPVVILTTSDAPSDIKRAYQIGANSYLVKPIGFIDMVDLMARLKAYWLELVTLPGDAASV